MNDLNLEPKDFRKVLKILSKLNRNNCIIIIIPPPLRDGHIDSKHILPINPRFLKLDFQPRFTLEPSYMVFVFEATLYFSIKASKEV